MNIDIKINVKGFPVPDFVVETVPPALPGPPSAVPAPAEPYPGERRFKLSELSSADLAELCDRFTDAVFKKAGRIPPLRTENVPYGADGIVDTRL